MKKVVFGILGSVMDIGKGPSRWDKWRPTVALCRHEDLLIDRLELIYQKRFTDLARQVEKDIHSVSPETVVNLIPIEFNDPWDFEEVYSELHDFAGKYTFDPESEEYIVHITTGTHVVQICLFLLTESHRIPGKLIQTSPPTRTRGDAGPGSYSIIDLDLSRYDKIASRFRKEATDDISFLKSGIETRNAEFNQLIERIEQVAINSKRPILLTGRTGAGKSQLARRIYDLKHLRRQVSGRFVEVNCATLKGDMAMSALFGHRKGAFSGAVSDRNGLLREADKGILFLDEVAELGTDEQAMLLRALEEKTFIPVGSDKEVGSDFQLICGTNRDLMHELTENRFREDLLARINLWTFHMPDLKDRPEDIEPNLYYELDLFEKINGLQITFSKSAFKMFLDFAVSPEARWKANFRDLNAAVTRMATLARGGRITDATVKDEMERLWTAWGFHVPKDSGFNELITILSPAQIAEIDRFDLPQLDHVIKVCKESATISEAGRKLFSVSRKQKKNTNDSDRLRKYLARFSINWIDIKERQIQPVK